MQPASEVPLDPPGARLYEITCLASLLVVFAGLMNWGFGLMTLAPVLVGLAGLSSRKPRSLWRASPLLLLVTVIFMLVIDALWFGANRASVEVADGLLAGGLLAFTISHFRLQGLIVLPVMPDPRRPAKQVTGPSRRSVRGAEVLGLAVWIPCWLILGTVAWNGLPDNLRYLRMPSHWWRTLLLFWLIGLVIFLTNSILAYLAQRRSPSKESLLFLQDTLWRETRGEQRRINRWLAWGRLKHARRKGRP